MPTFYDVGTGKTYASATGIHDALDAIVTATGGDFTAESDHHIVRVWGGFTYVTNDPNKIYTFTNTTSAKTVKVIVQDIYRHLGIFGAGITCQYSSVGVFNGSFLKLTCDYMEVEGLDVEVTSAVNTSTILFHPINCVSPKFRNIIIRVNNNDSGMSNFYGFWSVNSSCEFYNILGWNLLELNRVMILVRTTAVKIYNCLGHNFRSGYDLGNLANEVYNSGHYFNQTQVLSVSAFTGTAGATGFNNYGNINNSSFGTNYIHYTDGTTEFAFVDSANNDYRLKRGSVLRGSGYDVSASNPQDIAYMDWTGSHRSPFTYDKITSTFFYPPRQLNIVSPQYRHGLKADYISDGKDKSVASGGVFLEAPNAISYGSNGPEDQEVTGAVKFMDLNFGSVKKTTVLAILNIHNGLTTGSNSVINNDRFQMVFDSDATNNINFKCDTLTATVNYNAFLDSTDWFSILWECDLTKGSNNFDVYFYQKGLIRKETPTTSGAIPSVIPSMFGTLFSSGEFVTPYIAIWDKTFYSAQRETILRDPWKGYREDVELDLFLATGIIQQKTAWFLRKFIF